MINNNTGDGRRIQKPAEVLADIAGDSRGVLIRLRAVIKRYEGHWRQQFSRAVLNELAELTERESNTTAGGSEQTRDWHLTFSTEVFAREQRFRLA